MRAPGGSPELAELNAAFLQHIGRLVDRPGVTNWSVCAREYLAYASKLRTLEEEAAADTVAMFVTSMARFEASKASAAANLRYQLWLHWSDPELDAAEGRVLCRSRRQMVWTVMHIAERLEILPSEMWMLIFTFVKHEHPPTYR